VAAEVKSFGESKISDVKFDRCKDSKTETFDFLYQSGVHFSLANQT
jgi:hypothetical protein